MGAPDRRIRPLEGGFGGGPRNAEEQLSLKITRALLKEYTYVSNDVDSLENALTQNEPLIESLLLMLMHGKDRLQRNEQK